ncbi:Immunoglobulin-like domain [Trinorchestia longiramus]|nr:Immunoglobulin-like domain [Trinorchestia longiramus]
MLAAPKSSSDSGRAVTGNTTASREDRITSNWTPRRKEWRRRSHSHKIQRATTEPTDFFDALDDADLSFVDRKRNLERDGSEEKRHSTAGEPNSIIASRHDANVNVTLLFLGSQGNFSIASRGQLVTRKTRSVYVVKDGLTTDARNNNSPLLHGHNNFSNVWQWNTVTEGPYIKRQDFLNDKMSMGLSSGTKNGILQDAPYSTRGLLSQTEVDHRVSVGHNAGLLKKETVGTGPVWLVEPPQAMVFSNSSGGKVDCQVGGVGAPIQVTWLQKNLAPVEHVPGLLTVSDNGSLVFFPFSSHSYSPSLHASSYSCVSSFPLGALLSLPVRVRAVVDVPYEAHVRDQHVMAGNVAVLTCELPSYVRDYVTVTSWLRDDAFNIFPSLRGGEYVHSFVF